jgi:basic amino acid/polyamine antiporter, APA family
MPDGPLPEAYKWPAHHGKHECALGIIKRTCRRPVPRLGLIEVIAFVFAVFTLYGCGAKAVLYGTIMLVLGIPVYVWQRRRASQAIATT